MRYLHSMIRVSDLDRTLEFFSSLFGMRETHRRESETGRFTLVFLAAPDDTSAYLELTYNWDPEDYGNARNFGHLAFQVDDIYATCQRAMDSGIVINRPPRDGYMAFFKTPDNISIELLQRGERLPEQEPWASMPNTGTW